MDANQQALAAMRAVTVSREYGSGGGEIAARLARQLNWQLVDHQIVVRAASELEIRETEVAAHDEYVESTLSRIVRRIRNFDSSSPPAAEPLAYQETLRHVVKAAADTGHVVIVGRGGQALLADQRDVLHIRVVAPLDQRVAYVVSREGLDTEAARKRVQAKDQARTRYMQTQYRCQHDDARLYDLVINTGVLSLDGAVHLICLALEDKASRLNVPVEQLGPAAGVTRYTSKAADFPVPPQSSS